MVWDTVRPESLWRNVNVARPRDRTLVDKRLLEEHGGPEGSKHAQFEMGDTIVTSGYSSMFPPGIMVGKVVKESDSEDGLSYRLEVKLSTDFGRLRDVCVIDDSAVRERLNLLRQAIDSIKPQRNQ